MNRPAPDRCHRLRRADVRARGRLERKEHRHLTPRTLVLPCQWCGWRPGLLHAGRGRVARQGRLRHRQHPRDTDRGPTTDRRRRARPDWGSTNAQACDSRRRKGNSAQTRDHRHRAGGHHRDEADHDLTGRTRDWMDTAPRRRKMALNGRQRRGTPGEYRQGRRAAYAVRYGVVDHGPETPRRKARRNSTEGTANVRPASKRTRECTHSLKPTGR